MLSATATAGAFRAVNESRSSVTDFMNELRYDLDRVLSQVKIESEESMKVDKNNVLVNLLLKQ